MCVRQIEEGRASSPEGRKKMARVMESWIFTDFQRVPVLAAGSGKGVAVIARLSKARVPVFRFSGCFLKTLTVADLSKKSMVQPEGVLKSEMKKTRRGVQSDKTPALLSCYQAEAQWCTGGDWLINKPRKGWAGANAGFKSFFISFKVIFLLFPFQLLISLLEIE